eukprot:14285309-Alexandrium_andersonii.AAC.1
MFSGGLRSLHAATSSLADGCMRPTSEIVRRIAGVRRRGPWTPGGGIHSPTQHQGCLLYTSPSPRD